MLKTIAIPGFRYEDAGHLYFYNEAPKPSLSEILGVFKNPFWTPGGREEGKLLHLACQYVAEGTLDRAWLDEILAMPESPSFRPKAIVGRVLSYETWFKLSKFQPLYLEQPVYHHQLGFGTTPDQVGYLGPRLTVVELKRNTKEKWHRLQTAGQKLALNANGIPVTHRMGLYLREEGMARPDLHDDPADENYFTALALGLQAKRIYGGNHGE